MTAEYALDTIYNIISDDLCYDDNNEKLNHISGILSEYFSHPKINPVHIDLSRLYRIKFNNLLAKTTK